MGLAGSEQKKPESLAEGRGDPEGSRERAVDPSGTGSRHQVVAESLAKLVPAVAWETDCKRARKRDDTAKVFSRPRGMALLIIKWKKE